MRNNSECNKAPRRDDWGGNCVMKQATRHLWNWSLNSTARLAGLLALAGPRPVQGQITNALFAPGTTNYGKSYPEWLAAYGQWAAASESIHNPLYGTADLGEGQAGPVWFLSLFGDNGSAPI